MVSRRDRRPRRRVLRHAGSPLRLFLRATPGYPSVGNHLLCVRGGVPEWTFQGISFVDRADPCIWYPVPGARIVAIWMGKGTLASPTQLFVQLAHEIVHLLAPAGPGIPAARIEEGVATLYARHVAMRIVPGGRFHWPDENYLSAEREVNALNSCEAGRDPGPESKETLLQSD